MSIVCGNRAHQSLREYLGTAEGQRPVLVQVHHEDVVTVRRCFATEGGLLTLEDQDLQADARAEAAAEEGYERWLENGGPHAASIAAEYAMEERIEQQRGVIPFNEAMAVAEFHHADDRMWS